MVISPKNYLETKRVSPRAYEECFFVPFKGTSGMCIMTLDHKPMNDKEAMEYCKQLMSENSPKPVPAEGAPVFTTSPEGENVKADAVAGK